ncbi:branched-chain amino acid ABC transporter permease [Acuticoccus sp. I52.16.1]|uniref:branched-chain amino acid ABC transporter permease n=1 Tax=Acuticoccus sp. I52.16.1 TaxID=2928472 RepID=UPI001FD3A30C|nr:branched-chain amino acid ABC transporter permease [Acuticoccus sp. I52.16.1]UOM35011.1 branched-chain amino acid ABC transporter permease [Acuticoccus sp. I52.16.1]
MTDTQILIESVLQALVAGLLIGAIYGLMCVGLALIFGIMRVINFAQGDFMMLGMYAAFFIFGSFGVQSLFGGIVGPYVAVALAGPLLFCFGWAVHKVLIRQVTGIRTSDMEAEGHYAQLILTLGIALVLQNGAMILFGAQLMSLRTPLASEAFMVAPLWADPVAIFLNKARVVSAVVSVGVIVALWLAITRTRLGKSLRAAADNPEASTYMGINVDRSHRIAFALGTAITAVAGGLLATNYPFHPFVGLEYVIVMYAGVVLGGIGSVIGAFWGGMTIGLVQQLSVLVLPTQLQNATIFVFFLLIVILRPQGFFGRVWERT